MRRRGPCLTDTHKKRRVEFCKRMLRDFKERRNENKIIFSDECMLDDNDYGKQWQWCRGKEVPSNMRMDPGPHSVLVWCAIGVNFRTIVVLPRQLLNAESYQKKILNRNVVQLLAAECRRGSVFQQDNARPHCRSALYLGKRGVKVLDWPARSPDLSPVETIWSWLRREVAATAPFGEAEVESATIAAFNGLPRSRIDKLVQSFPGRCRQCVKERGATIKPK